MTRRRVLSETSASSAPNDTDLEGDDTDGEETGSEASDDFDRPETPIGSQSESDSSASEEDDSELTDSEEDRFNGKQSGRKKGRNGGGGKGIGKGTAVSRLVANLTQAGGKKRGEIPLVVLAAGFGLFVFVLSTLLGGSGRREVGDGGLSDTDLFDCSAVPQHRNTDLLQGALIRCQAKAGYRLRVIESQVSSVLIEVSDNGGGQGGFGGITGLVGGGSGGRSVLGGLFSSYLTLLIYGVLGGAGWAYFNTEDGKKKWRLLKQKNLEISHKIKNKVHVYLQNKRERAHQRVERVQRGRRAPPLVSDTEFETDYETEG